MIFFKFKSVGTRPPVESIDPCVRDELDKILIAVIVFCQHDEVVPASVPVVLVFVLLSVTCHIHLTSEDGLERFKSIFLSPSIDLVAIVEEFLYSKHVSMVSDSHSLHAVGNSLIYELGNTRLSVKYGVVCVYVKMYKILHFSRHLLFSRCKVTVILRNNQKKSQKVCLIAKKDVSLQCK